MAFSSTHLKGSSGSSPPSKYLPSLAYITFYFCSSSINILPSLLSPHLASTVYLGDSQSFPRIPRALQGVSPTLTLRGQIAVSKPNLHPPPVNHSVVWPHRRRQVHIFAWSTSCLPGPHSFICSFIQWTFDELNQCACTIVCVPKLYQVLRIWWAK